MSDYLSAEEDRLKVRRSFLPDFAKAIPGKKVARFYQIENKLDTAILADISEAIPLAR
jgi:hypothetical protein